MLRKNCPTTRRRPKKTIVLVVTLGVAALSMTGTSLALQADEARTVGPTDSHAETPNYTAEMVATGAYKAGTEGTVKVTVAAKGAYHINPQYPYKFKAAVPAPEGVTFPKPVLQRSDGTFDEMHGTFLLPFVAAKAGKQAVGGVLYLSVCTAANCVVDKVPLDVTIEVK